MEDWFIYNDIKDNLTKKYRLIRKKHAWYGILNDDRNSFVHRLNSPHVISIQLAKQAGVFISKDKMFNIRDKKQKFAKITSIESETRSLLRNVLDFLVFSDFFFKEKLQENKIVISKQQFKVSLLGDFRQFNKLLF